jgi:hypothetical protein
MNDIPTKWIMDAINNYCMIFPLIGLGLFFILFRGFYGIPLIMWFWSFSVWSFGFIYYIKKKINKVNKIENSIR